MIKTPFYGYTPEQLESSTKIASWADYVKQNKFQRPIWFHLSSLAFPCWREGIHKRNDCIHEQLGLTVDSLVDALIGIVTNQRYSISISNVSRLIFTTDPAGKKLCNDCILVFLFKTNYCQTIIDQYHQIYCHSNSYIQTNVCIIYFSQLILCYPLVIKFILAYTSNINKLFEILIFYLKKMKLDSLDSNPQFFSPQKKYNIINKEIVAIFTFEYNLCCILSMFESLIPYFSRTNLAMLTKYKFTEIYTTFILKYSSLKHIKANVNAFYKRSCKHMSPTPNGPNYERFKKATSGPIQEGTVHTYFTFCNINIPIDDMVNRRNAMLHKLVGVYCYYLQKMKKFKDDPQFTDSYNRFYKFSASQLLHFRTKIDNETAETNVSYESKVQFFFSFASNTKLHSIKEVRNHYRKWKICSNDKCKRKRKKLSFRVCCGCQLVLYCSRHCQKLDWIAGHRNYCKLLDIENLIGLLDIEIIANCWT
eukprot:47630_1